MHRFLSSLFVSVFALSLGTSAAFAAAPGPMATKAAKMSSMMATTCPKGQTWVKPYSKKDGTKVKGYCRKSK